MGTVFHIMQRREFAQQAISRAVPLITLYQRSEEHKLLIYGNLTPR